VTARRIGTEALSPKLKSVLSVVMRVSSNFEFLAVQDERLARLGVLVERYFFDDAPSTLIKLRQLAEFLTKEVAARHGLLPSSAASFEEVLRTLKVRAVLPPEMPTSLQQGDFGISINEVYTGDGDVIYRHACAFGCEGIVSKRLGSAYRMGRTDVWLKTKNPLSPAVRREREIDWSKR
jgi:hypothetical protein